MNQNDSQQEIKTKDESNASQIEREGQSTESDPVDEYMRHVGKTLYEIIRDWVREQNAHTRALRDPEFEENKSVKGGTA